MTNGQTPQEPGGAHNSVLLIRFDEDEYRAASFLDERILTPKTDGAWVPISRITETVRAVADLRPLHYIFHIGHVGSTLLSRMIDETGQVLSLREPLPLRTLAEAPDPEMLELFLCLWSRGFPSTRAVVLKATSSAARIAPQLLTMRPQSRAVYMYLRAEPYLAALLAGENAAIDLNGHRPERTRRLAAHLGEEPPAANSLGELAALSWLAERMTMQTVTAAHGTRVLALDFEAFLADVPSAFARVIAHFGLTVNAATIGAIARGPILSHYSKAPEFEYSPAFRAQLVWQSRRDNAAEIRRGLAWLSALASRHRAVAALA